ncbi:MAG: hypothetical protein MUE62_13255, partial [Burkholderiaceae bacterium]|nr:hypothetical protein [Burkholderiaceae bacterium]
MNISPAGSASGAEGGDHRDPADHVEQHRTAVAPHRERAREQRLQRTLAAPVHERWRVPEGDREQRREAEAYDHAPEQPVVAEQLVELGARGFGVVARGHQHLHALEAPAVDRVAKRDDRQRRERVERAQLDQRAPPAVVAAQRLDELPRVHRAAFEQRARRDHEAQRQQRQR